MSTYTGSKWGSSAAKGTPGGVVTWSFATLPGYFYQFDRPITEAAFQALVRAAFQVWEDNANIDFVETSDRSDVDIRLGWDAIDGRYNTVGTTSWQTSTTLIRAEIRFDTGEIWSTDPTSPGGTSVNFFATAVHEIGHAIGLSHTQETSSIMYPYVSSQLGLSASDVAAIVALYGGAQASTPTIRGTAGADTLRGNATSETIFGYGGNDTITGAGGNDLIDGGPGIDRAAYSGGRGSYSVNVESNGNVSVIDNRIWSPDGTDSLVNIERLVFADGVLAVDINGGAGNAYRLYQAAFDRTPDNAGLRFWVDRADSGMGPVEMAARFIDSHEFRTLYGNSPGREQFIDLLYENVLNRDADASGFSYWNQQMSAGMSDAEVLARFADSTENRLNVIGTIEDGIWLG